MLREQEIQSELIQQRDRAVAAAIFMAERVQELEAHLEDHDATHHSNTMDEPLAIEEVTE